MKILLLGGKCWVPGILLVLLSGCAASSVDFGNGTDVSLPLIPGAATLELAKTRRAVLTLPASMQRSSGNILMFSPIEFSSKKDRFSIEAAALPLGRYIALRHSGEGITAGVGSDEARSFNLHYDARYPDLAAARHDFPRLAAAQYRHIRSAGNTTIEIEQWRMRLSMIFSKDRQAFRVLLDNLSYTAPSPQSAADNADIAQDEASGLPVIVAFSYRHPDSVQETLIQQNIFFEFKVAGHNGSYHASPQISGWLPLPARAQSLPYTVGIVVAEVHENREDFYKKLINIVKNVRGLI